MTIPEGRDASVHWTLRAKDQLGNADIVVTAHHGSATSSLVSHVSIRPPAPFLTTLNAGYFTDAQKRVDLTRQMYPQFNANTVHRPRSCRRAFRAGFPIISRTMNTAARSSW